jgi:hypothetical protein
MKGNFLTYELKATVLEIILDALEEVKLLGWTIWNVFYKINFTDNSRWFASLSYLVGKIKYL